MILDFRRANNYAHVKFKRTLMFSGKGYSKWLKIKMQELDQEFFILFVMVVHKDFKIKFIKLYKNLIMIKIQI